MAPVVIPNSFQVIYVTNIYTTRFELSVYLFLPVQNVEWVKFIKLDCDYGKNVEISYVCNLAKTGENLSYY